MVALLARVVGAQTVLAPGIGFGRLTELQGRLDLLRRRAGVQAGQCVEHMLSAHRAALQHQAHGHPTATDEP